jgi:phosphate starvation-inducible PhoH-like protein
MARKGEEKKTFRKAFHLEFKNAAQKMAWAAFEQHDILFLVGPAGVGKSLLATAFAIGEIINKRKSKIILTRPIVEAGEHLGFLPGPQPLDAKVLTLNGWKLMGEINVEDMVIGRDGKPHKVIGVFPKGKKTVYKITTTDNTSTECCQDHLWFTRTAEDRKRNYVGSVKSTKEIMDSLLKKGKINHFIPRNEPVEFEKKILPIPPYTLGALLGDGAFTNSTCLSNYDNDCSIRNRVAEEILRLGYSLTRGGSNSICYYFKANVKVNKPARKIIITNMSTGCLNEYPSALEASKVTGINLGVIKHRCNNKSIISGNKYEFIPLKKRWSGCIKNSLDDLGLSSTRSHNKFIPDLYKFSSIEDRIDLLRGLMDTDGTIKKNGEASFTTVSKQLALDIIELVQSLGGRAVLRERNRVNKGSSYKERMIVSRRITYEFNISLPNEINPFYIKRKANRHNSNYIHGVGIKSIDYVGEKETQCILLDNPEHLYITDQYIVTHNSADEKIDPYMLPLYDSIGKLVGWDGPDRERINRCIETAPLAFMRGRNFIDSVCIFDEAQNATLSQLILFLTRMGENCKLIITGDPAQSDLPGPVALMEVVKKLQVEPEIGIIEFNNASIVRHPLVGRILELLGK